MGRRPAPQVPRPPNPYRNQREIRAPTPIRRPPPPPPNKRACPNKECTEPMIEDGVCHGCGTIIDDSNIVSEVQFGENSQGAAVVQGTFIGAEQGAARPSGGPGLGRVGGSNKEKTFQEAKFIMQLLATGLKIPDATISSGNQILKLAGDFNFIQGRRLDMVVAVCLYSACRKEKPCRVMLIDFADRIQVNVFKLGHTFKELHKHVTLAKDGIQPILPEDLIYRFAQKMDFGSKAYKVAEDAVRMAKRMSQDWMVMGRRPSGVCGACLILAARMNNFRRTVMEVVYIVKVTTHTIQKRLEEFKLTPSSALTVEEFINNEFLEQAHDPPSFYEKQEEFIKNKKTRKRKRHLELGEDEEGGADGNPDKRQRSADPDAPLPSVELRRDADGFVIPPQPVQSRDIPIDPELIDNQTGSTFEQLADEFGDRLAESDEVESTATIRARKGPNNSDIHVPDEWLAAERQLEREITEMISDPNSIEHAMHYNNAKKRTEAYMLWLEQENQKKGVVPPNMDTCIDHDEFADDPEVQNCILDVEDSKIKEQLWLNENRLWLRKQQVKEANAKLAKNGPPKATRKRKKVARIGEGQSSPASSAGDAAVETIKTRGWSKKINYDAIRAIAETTPGHKSRLGSAATSRAGSVSGESNATASVAGSAIGSPRIRPRETINIPDDESVASSVRAASPTASVATSVAETDDHEGEDDWRNSLRREKPVDEFGELEDDVEPEYGMGDVDDDDLGFDQDNEYGNGDDDDGY